MNNFHGLQRKARVKMSGKTYGKDFLYRNAICVRSGSAMFTAEVVLKYAIPLVN